MFRANKKCHAGAHNNRRVCDTAIADAALGRVGSTTADYDDSPANRNTTMGAGRMFMVVTEEQQSGASHNHALLIFRNQSAELLRTGGSERSY